MDINRTVLIGRRNALRVVREASPGLYLGGGDQLEILLPGRYIPPHTVPGDMIDVFVYLDSEDRLVATTETPRAMVGEFAYLKVANVANGIGAFLDWIGKDPGLDATRIGVRGESYGGYMTLATLFHYSNRVRCGSDLMGISDFVTLLRNTRPYWLASARYEFGDERYPEMNKFLQSVSPLNHVQEIGDPVMITAGKNDPRVPEGESDQMAQALRARKGIVWYVLGENEGHGFSQSPDEAYQEAAEAYFFQTYLLPEQRLTPLLPEEKPASAPVQTQGPD